MLEAHLPGTANFESFHGFAATNAIANEGHIVLRRERVFEWRIAIVGKIGIDDPANRQRCSDVGYASETVETEAAKEVLSATAPM